MSKNLSSIIRNAALFSAALISINSCNASGVVGDPCKDLDAYDGLPFVSSNTVVGEAFGSIQKAQTNRNYGRLCGVVEELTEQLGFMLINKIRTDGPYKIGEIVESFAPVALNMMQSANIDIADQNATAGVTMHINFLDSIKQGVNKAILDSISSFAETFLISAFENDGVDYIRKGCKASAKMILNLNQFKCLEEVSLGCRNEEDWFIQNANILVEVRNNEYEKTISALEEERDIAYQLIFENYDVFSAAFHNLGAALTYNTKRFQAMISCNDATTNIMNLSKLKIRGYIPAFQQAEQDGRQWVRNSLPGFLKTVGLAQNEIDVYITPTLPLKINGMSFGNMTYMSLKLTSTAFSALKDHGVLNAVTRTGQFAAKGTILAATAVKGAANGIGNMLSLASSFFSGNTSTDTTIGDNSGVLMLTNYEHNTQDDSDSDSGFVTAEDYSESEESL